MATIEDFYKLMWEMHVLFSKHEKTVDEAKYKVLLDDFIKKIKNDTKEEMNPIVKKQIVDALASGGTI